MDNQTKTKLALIMLPSQLRRTILLTLLMIAALTIVAKTVLPNRMHPKIPSYIAKTKNNLEKMRRTKCLTRDNLKCLKTNFFLKTSPRMFHLGLGINKFTRMVNGNGRSSYNIALWN